MTRLRAFLSDAFWLYLFPAAAIAMPWRWYFALCKRLAGGTHPYRAAIEEQLGYAMTLLPGIDAERFRHEQALVRFVDAADFYLNLGRSHRWFRRYVTVDGAWPERTAPMLLLGSHWGAAHWIWRDLRHHGIQAWFVARPTEAADYGRGRLARWYGSFRGWGIRHAGSAGVITTGGARSRIDALLSRGEALVVLNDVPNVDGHPSSTTTLLGRRVDLPTGTLELAQRHPSAFAMFTMSLDLRTGRRTLSIHRLGANGTSPPDVAALIDSFAAGLDERLRLRPGSWQIWSLAPQLFSAKQPTASKG